jgi:hypothetical protein
MIKFEQIWEYRWPSNADKPVGALRLGPSELGERYHLHFRPGLDDLDAYIQVGLRLPSGRVVQLLRYDAYADAGTFVFVDREDDAESARRELVSALDTDDGVFAWIQ